MKRTAIVGWIVLGIAVLLWLVSAAVPAAPWLWALALGPIVLFLPGMMFGWRNAFAYPMLATIPYAILGITELIASAGNLRAAATMAAAAFTVFFLLIPATRKARREESP